VRTFLIFGLAVLLAGCATADRVVPAPIVLPAEGTATAFIDMQPKLRQLTWQATEAFYRDDWKTLVDTAKDLDKASRMLKSSTDVPARLQPLLAPKCDELANESAKLAESAQAAAIDPIGIHLQRINNIVRELRPEI
jgi:hypothetical protein